MIRRVWKFSEIFLISLHSIDRGGKVVERVDQSRQNTTVAQPHQNSLNIQIYKSTFRTDGDFLLSLNTEFFSCIFLNKYSTNMAERRQEK